MENLQFFLLVLQVVVAVVMIILVLLQKSDGDSLGGIGGGSGPVFSLRRDNDAAIADEKIVYDPTVILDFSDLIGVSHYSWREVGP